MYLSNIDTYKPDTSSPNDTNFVNVFCNYLPSHSELDKSGGDSLSDGELISDASILTSNSRNSLYVSPIAEHLFEDAYIKTALILNSSTYSDFELDLCFQDYPTTPFQCY